MSTSLLLIILITLCTVVIVSLVILVGSYKRKGNDARHRQYNEKTENEEHVPLNNTVYTVESRSGKTETKFFGCRKFILSINEREADKIQGLPLNGHTISFEHMYTPVLISDENISGYENNKENITLEKLLNPTNEKSSRFVFMLGEAGYGKTIQCQRIARAWCKAWQNESFPLETDLMKLMKTFDYLFFIQMRNVNYEHISLIDMIQESYGQKDVPNAIPFILEDEQYKGLVLLDGLDEWNLSEESNANLEFKGLPNFGEIPNTTVLITMRYSKFIEVKKFCRQNVDKVVRLHGLDENGIAEFTAKMLCSYFQIERLSDTFMKKYQKLQNAFSNCSHSLKSLMKIPLLAVFCIITTAENVESGYSLTTFYLSLLETLLEKGSLFNSRTMHYVERKSYKTVLGILAGYKSVFRNLDVLLDLGKIAYNGLALEKKKTFVFKKEELNELCSEEILKSFNEIGLLRNVQSSSDPSKSNVRITFLHTSLQEFFASLSIWSDTTLMQDFLLKKVSNIEKALEFSTISTFLSGLSHADGCTISTRLSDLASEDTEIMEFREHFPSGSYEKVFRLYDLQMACYREVRGLETIKAFQENERGMTFVLSDIILHGRDTDTHIIRETAEVLNHHANDIKSFQMKFVPCDERKGITNEELNRFLSKSSSFVSINIDGYVDGKCRLFSNFTISENLCLSTLWLHNVAFVGDLLEDLLSKVSTRENLRALGLFDLKTADDLTVSYKYLFDAGRMTRYRIGARSGYEQKQRVAYSYESIHHASARDRKEPLMKGILAGLPKFKVLSTFHVYYLDSPEDRELLLHVLPLIKTLDYFGYHGSSVKDVKGNIYDASVLKLISEELTHLCRVFLSEINLENKELNFKNISEMKEIKLQDFQMNRWEEFVNYLKENKKLTKVVFTNTNTPVDIIDKLQRNHQWFLKNEE